MRVFKSKVLMGNNAIGIVRSSPKQVCPDHTHDYIEIVYVTRGRAAEYVDGMKYEVVRGDMIFMTPNSIHSINPSADYEKIEIFFSPSLIGSALSTTRDMLTALALSSFNDMRASKNYGLIRFKGADITEIEFLLSLMEKEYGEKNESYEQFMCNCLNLLLVKMIRGSKSEQKDVWSMIAEYLNENCEKPISLTALSAKCFYNPSYFSRAFKEKFKCSLTEYIKRLRIERAKLLLLTDKSTVEEISHRVGFADRSAFYRAFYNDTKTTPANYRLNNKK